MVVVPISQVAAIDGRAENATILLVIVSGFMPQPFEAYCQNAGLLLAVATRKEKTMRHVHKFEMQMY